MNRQIALVRMCKLCSGEGMMRLAVRKGSAVLASSLRFRTDKFSEACACRRFDICCK
ncbi:hypothetical protein BDR07DRAFT_1430234 [Suillus spraguei]|nr:hypothetical protein BDR07DRAFT_1430234 [Suillus spraguei]